MAAPRVGTCLSAGIEGLKNNFVNHVIATILLWLVNGVSFGLLYGPLHVGYMRMAQIEDEGGKAQIGDLFKGFDDFVPALVSGLIALVVVSIGFFACILPGLVLMPLLPLSAYFVATGEKDGVNAFKRAWAVYKRNVLSSFWCALVLSIVGALGTLLFGVGIFLTLPITLIGMYAMSKEMAADEEPANG